MKKSDRNKEITYFESKMKTSLDENMQYLNEKLAVDANFDVVYRIMEIGGKRACMYFVDGFCKDDLMQKMLQYFITITPKDMPQSAHEMSKQCIPYVEVDLQDEWKKIIFFVLSGVFALFVDGYDKCILIDSRTYPARNVSEPEKDKVLRGSKDGFVETVIFNTALIRRRIRSSDLRMEMMNAGKSSKTDIVVCYMDSRVDHDFLDKIKSRIRNIKVDALTMNQESLAECLYKEAWWNPFPKFKFTERPDTAAAQVLEGNIVILVDNSPSAMIMPTSIFDVVEEADDYYFPPVTGTYLRLSRFLIAILTYIMTPTFLLLMQNPDYIPHGFEFIMVKDTINVPLVWQFDISYPKISGWFNSEVMLYMAFVAIANYTQASYELSYALKFMRILNLILTALFGIYGYIAGSVVLVLCIVLNRTVSGQSYIYPLLPFNLKQLSKRFLRKRLPESRQ